MMDLVKQNKFLFVIAALVIAGFVWYGLSEKKPKEGLLTSESVSGAQSAAERELLDTLLELRSIQLSGQIFGDPAFGRLQDFSTQIVSEPIGRKNPFAPLGSDSSSSSVDGTTEE